jgi:hypothetical protein
MTLPDYKDFIENKTLLITPVTNSVLKSKTEIKEIFGDSDVSATYIPFFQKKLADILSRVSSFSKIESHPLADSVELKAREFVIPGNDTSYFYLPVNKKIIHSKDNTKPDFILFLSKLEVSPSWIDIEYGQKPNIRHTLYYLFWDNHSAKAVCYGRADYIDGAAQRNKESFSLWINNLAKSLIENTPFRKRRNQW